MAEAISDNRTRDLFTEARQIKGRYNANPWSVDSCTGDKNILYLFGDKYNNLYNRVPYNKQEIEGICHEINGRLSKHIDIYKWSVDDVEKSAKRKVCWY